MQNSTNFNAVRTQGNQLTPPNPINDHVEFQSTLTIINSGQLSFKTFSIFIKNNKCNEDEKIEIITRFLSVDNDNNTANITCIDFAKMINSLGISDENKKMKLITEFLGSNKVKISSLQQDDFIESLNIKEDSAKQALGLIKDALNQNDIKAIHQVFDVFKPIFESEGLKTNIVENFIINSPQPITQDSVDRYLIKMCSITIPKYINRINKALTEIYPTQAPTQSKAGSIAEVEEIQPIQEATQSGGDLEIQTDTESRGSSQLSVREANLFKFLKGKDLSIEEKEEKTRIEKWIKESENPNSQSQTIATSSNQTQSQPQQNFQPQKVEPLPEYSVTASLVMERPQANSQATTSTPTQLSRQTQGQQLSPPSQQNKNNCCTVS
jgi:hypothetical protein